MMSVPIVARERCTALNAGDTLDKFETVEIQETQGAPVRRPGLLTG
ncbi:uncharacterized protein METZ01_LOCUS208113 [marine metagenome]|uniref:Uncharacterized protein n=1 Tax=marine metagenome TaxID=408172 RepID=A0A382EXV2_9ZZZZ